MGQDRSFAAPGITPVRAGHLGDGAIRPVGVAIRPREQEAENLAVLPSTAAVDAALVLEQEQERIGVEIGGVRLRINVRWTSQSCCRSYGGRVVRDASRRAGIPVIDVDRLCRRRRTV